MLSTIWTVGCVSSLCVSFPTSDLFYNMNLLFLLLVCCVLYGFSSWCYVLLMFFCILNVWLLSPHPFTRWLAYYVNGRSLHNKFSIKLFGNNILLLTTDSSGDKLGLFWEKNFGCWSLNRHHKPTLILYFGRLGFI